MAQWEQDIYCILSAQYFLSLWHSLCHGIFLSQPMLQAHYISFISTLRASLTNVVVISLFAVLFQMFSSSATCAHTYLLPFKFSLFCLVLGSVLFNENRKRLKFFGFLAKVFFLRSNPHFIAILLCIYFLSEIISPQNLEMNEFPHKWRVCEAWFLLPTSYLSIACLSWTTATGYRPEVCVTSGGVISLITSAGYFAFTVEAQV